MLDAQTRHRPQAERLLVANAALSLLLLGGLVAGFWLYDSRLALAQAADSFSDIFTASALLLSMRIASQPADRGHPIGHQRAEPIAALIAAVVAGVLAVEVLREAVLALVAGETAEMSYLLVGAFGAKVLAKTVIAVLARAGDRAQPSPAMHALYIDARNDVAVGLVAVVGFFVARYGWPAVDAWLAIPVALWVGWSGFDLARENIRLLMGAAPPEQRQQELLDVARQVPGVRSVHDLRALFHGTQLDVLVHVVVDPELTVRRAHDIGHAVERRLIDESDVCHAVAHVDVEQDEPDEIGATPPAPREA